MDQSRQERLARAGLPDQQDRDVVTRGHFQIEQHLVEVWRVSLEPSADSGHHTERLLVTQIIGKQRRTDVRSLRWKLGTG